MEGGAIMVYIKLSDSSAEEYLKMFYQIQRHERLLERLLDRRIPVKHNREMMSFIKKLEAVGGKKYKGKDIKII
jgi:hypothetical protein